MRKIAFDGVLGRVWLIFSVTCLFIGIVATLGYTNLVAADSSVGDPLPIPPEYEELLKEARENGSVLVTVTFDVGFQPSSMTVYENYVASQWVRDQLILKLSGFNLFTLQ